MRLILIGAPGAGKGTQAVLLAQRYNVPNISTGDIFRNQIKEGTDLGIRAQKYINKGQLVPDKITIGMMKDRLMEQDCINGFILDGFPRSISQAKGMEIILDDIETSIDRVINLQVEEHKIISRITGRRVCSKCSKVYHLSQRPLGMASICDCGAKLMQREDDTEKIIKNRLVVYYKQTEPLIEYYQNNGLLVTVQGTDSVKETDEIMAKVIEENRLCIR